MFAIVRFLSLFSLIVTLHHPPCHDKQLLYDLYNSRVSFLLSYHFHGSQASIKCFTTRYSAQWSRKFQFLSHISVICFLAPLLIGGNGRDHAAKTLSGSHTRGICLRTASHRRPWSKVLNPWASRVSLASSDELSWLKPSSDEANQPCSFPSKPSWAYHSQDKSSGIEKNQDKLNRMKLNLVQPCAKLGRVELSRAKQNRDWSRLDELSKDERTRN